MSLPEYPPELDQEYLEEVMGGPEEVEAANDRDEASWWDEYFRREADHGR